MAERPRILPLPPIAGFPLWQYICYTPPRRSVSPALMKICSTCHNTYPDDFSLCPRDGAPLTAQDTENEAQLAAGLSRRFRLVCRLGQGGMGTVFLAEQIAAGNRPVMVNLLILEMCLWNELFKDSPGLGGLAWDGPHSSSSGFSVASPGRRCSLVSTRQGRGAFLEAY